jgi:hypothetical protein
MQVPLERAFLLAGYFCICMQEFPNTPVLLGTGGPCISTQIIMMMGGDSHLM